MAYELEATVEAAIEDIENTLAEDLTVPGAREAIRDFRNVIAFIEALPNTGYTIPLGLKRNWAADKLGGAE